MKRVWLLVALLAGCGLASGVRAQDTAKPLIIGMELNYPPFEMTDAAGNPTGVGVDLARALGDYCTVRSTSRTCRSRG